MTVLQLEGGPRVRRVDQMGEVGEQCGDTLDYSSQLAQSRQSFAYLGQADACAAAASCRRPLGAAAEVSGGPKSLGAIGSTPMPRKSVSISRLLGACFC